MEARIIIGTLRIKENLAALNLSRPLYIPVAIVKPDLESPGNTANPCAMPIKIAVFRLSSFVLPFSFSLKNKIHPVKRSNIET